jgi:hypothetical protein
MAGLEAALDAAHSRPGAGQLTDEPADEFPARGTRAVSGRIDRHSGNSGRLILRLHVMPS